MMKRASLLAAVVTVLAAPAYAQKPQIQWNQDFAFDAVKTFQWQFTPETDLSQKEPFLHEHIKTTIEGYLTNAGLTEVQTNPDVYVNYSTSSETEIRLESDSYGYGYGGYGMGGWGYYGYGMAGPVSTTTRVHEYQVGTLVVDIWDPSSKELVWRGAVSDTVPSSVEKAEKLITKAVAKMVDQWRKMRAKAEKEKAKAQASG
jgi:hypothetical protein